MWMVNRGVTKIMAIKKKKYIYKKPPRLNLRKIVIKESAKLLGDLDGIYKKASYYSKNEKKLNADETDILCSYGIESLKIDLARMAAVKKSLQSILGRNACQARGGR